MQLQAESILYLFDIILDGLWWALLVWIQMDRVLSNGAGMNDVIMDVVQYSIAYVL